jgi:hypothetical protein
MQHEAIIFSSKSSLSLLLRYISCNFNIGSLSAFSTPYGNWNATRQRASVESLITEGRRIHNLSRIRGMFHMVGLPRHQSAHSGRKQVGEENVHASTRM